MITVIDRQTLLDVALQQYGNIAAVFDISLANEVNVSDTLDAGTEIELPESEYLEKDILNYYKQRQIKPVTDYGTII